MSPLNAMQTATGLIRAEWTRARARLKRARTALSSGLPWSRLRHVGKSRVLRSSYFWLCFVPLSAYVLAKTGSEIWIPIGSPELKLSIGLPFSWTVFYFSSVAFAAGSLVFSVCCPQIIRDYSGTDEFTNEGKGIQQVIHAMSPFRGSGSARDLGRRREFSKTAFGRTVGRGESIEDLLEERCDAAGLRRGFWWVHKELDNTKAASRLICAAFYFIGFFFLSWLLVQNFLWVCRVVF